MNLIDLNEVIDMISTLYRGERSKLADMRNERMALQEAINTEWKYISVARRNDIHSRLDELCMQEEACRQRAEGMHDVREMFLELLEGEE